MSLLNDVMKRIFLFVIFVLLGAVHYGQQPQPSLPPAEVEIVPATARGCQFRYRAAAGSRDFMVINEMKLLETKLKELPESLDQFRGCLVAVGLWPPWLDESEASFEAYVPDEAGMIMPGPY